MATITAPVGRRRSDADASVLAHLDLALLALPIAISALGLLMIFDASRHETAIGGPDPALLRRAPGRWRS